MKLKMRCSLRHLTAFLIILFICSFLIFLVYAQSKPSILIISPTENMEAKAGTPLEIKWKWDNYDSRKWGYGGIALYKVLNKENKVWQFKEILDYTGSEFTKTGDSYSYAWNIPQDYELGNYILMVLGTLEKSSASDKVSAVAESGVFSIIQSTQHDVAIECGKWLPTDAQAPMNYALIEDVNGDGCVKLNDVEYVASCQQSNDQFADVNKDGVVTIEDTTQVSGNLNLCS